MTKRKTKPRKAPKPRKTKPRKAPKPRPASMFEAMLAAKPAKHRAPLPGAGSQRAKPAHPEKRHSSGRILFEQPLGVHSAKGERPDLDAVKAWIERRRHVKHWRNRDGSYDAIVTVYGKNAWKVVRSIALTAPRPAYVCFRFQAYSLTEQPTSRHRSRSGGELTVRGLSVFTGSSPTVRARKKSVDWALTFPLSERMLRDDVAGLAVFWPGPSATKKPKKKGSKR